MCSSKQIKELAECNAIYEFEKTVNMYGKEYIRYYYNKLAELNGSINSTCNCQHNSNSRDNEPCCRCDSRKTNSDRIRNMSDEELADILFDSCVEHIDTDRCASAIREFTVRDDCIKCILDWLQSEAE
nr:MAG TPA: hypothetical protein [Bacteriophage sp.]